MSYLQNYAPASKLRRGMGVVASTRPQYIGPFGSRSIGPILARPFGAQSSSAGNPQPVGPETGSAYYAGNGSTSAQVAGTPVPVGYSTNSVFINSDGSQWEFSTSQGVWINVGTPYNLAAPSATTTPTTSSTASSGAQVQGTPVPVGYPTTSPYSDIYGNVWQYNAAVGMWTETSQASTAATILANGSGGSVPAGTSTAAPYIDASGNTWTYNPSTGQWVMTAAASADSYSSILNWLSQSTLLSPVPNWALVVGVGFLALKLWPSGGRR
jgi:hypothetical protein